MPSRYKVRLTLRVSRYKADKEQISRQVIVILLTVLAGSRYRHYKSVMGVGTKAKTMTSLLILTGVVSVVVPVSELQMLVKAQSFLKDVAVQVQEFSILSLS